MKKPFTNIGYLPIIKLNNLIIQFYRKEDIIMEEIQNVSQVELEETCYDWDNK